MQMETEMAQGPRVLMWLLQGGRGRSRAGLKKTHHWHGDRG